MARIAMLKPRVAMLDTALAPPPPKTTDPWYGTPEHKAWAAGVKERAGGRCQDPHHEGPRLVCKGVADHVKERRDRPDLQLDPANGLYRCWPCHTRKTHQQRALRQRGERQ